MESRRCTEHSLSSLLGFWVMIFSTIAAAGLSLAWDLDLAWVLGIQIGSPEIRMRG